MLLSADNGGPAEVWGDDDFDDAAGTPDCDQRAPRPIVYQRLLPDGWEGRMMDNSDRTSGHQIARKPVSPNGREAGTASRHDRKPSYEIARKPVPRTLG